jgi:glycerol-3-phosphate dehydrogenase
VPSGDPVPSDDEVDALLHTFDGVLRTPLHRGDVLGSFAGLRPLLAAAPVDTADLSRRHVVRRGHDGVITVVGGKFTTYRRMAEDAVDAAIDGAGLTARRCVTTRLPLVGAASRARLAQVPAPARLVARYGLEATRVTGDATPVAPGQTVTGAEFAFALRHEGALDVDDLLDRRTRIGLVPADRAAAKPAAIRALARFSEE